MVKASTGSASTALPQEASTEFIERLGIIWSEMGNPRADGRVFAFLLLSEEPYVSTKDLSVSLQLSAGTISGATRRLSDAGFIQRVGVPGERSHYYRAIDNCWGAFLETEYKFFPAIIQLADWTLNILSNKDRGARARVEDMGEYFEWLVSRRKSWADEWNEYRDSPAYRSKRRPAVR